MDIELKPCPFCGGEAKLSYIDGYFSVWCKICGAEAYGDTRGDAQANWNQRDGLSTLLDTIEQAVSSFDFDSGIGERAPMAVLNNALMAHGRESARIRRDNRDYAAKELDEEEIEKYEFCPTCGTVLGMAE